MGEGGEEWMEERAERGSRRLLQSQFNPRRERGGGNLKFKGAIRPAPKRPSLLVPTLPATFAVRSCAPLAVEYSSRDLAGDPALIARTVDNVKGEGTARGTHPRTFLARA